VGSSSGRLASTEPRDLIDRFQIAWKRIEQHLVHERSRPGTADMFETLRWAQQTRLISPSVEVFLQACRHVRNSYTHVVFDGYDGPVTFPPREVVERIERLGAGLLCPGRAVSVAPRATTCEASTPVHEALATMRRSDYSQLPYRHDRFGWVLFSRRQLAALVQGSTDSEGLSLLDLSISVGALADEPLVGPTVPSILPRSATAAVALEELEAALLRPDDIPGGYPAVLILDDGAGAHPSILTADDLPGLYDLLGR
jgi:hypothetical protein